MAFDPDEYLAEEPTGFDPDEYLGITPTQPVPRGTSALEMMKDVYSEQPQLARELGMEVITAINRGLVNFGEFLTTDQINNIAQLAGKDRPVPTVEETAPGVVTGDYMEPGIIREAVQTGGEMVGPALLGGAAIRGAAQTLPLTTPSTETIGQSVLRQAAGGTAAGDVGLAMASGAGAEIGEEIGGDTGAMVGSILAPVAATAGVKSLTNLVKSGKKGIEALTKSLSQMSDEGASQLLAEAMTREGLDPDDVVKMMADLGPEAIPADLGNTFARLLRASSNKIPRVQGVASNVFKQRHAGQAGRITSSFDDAAGIPSLNADDEIIRLNAATKPEIDRLYTEARSKPMKMSQSLKSLFSGKNAIGSSQKKVQKRLANKRAAGDEITNIDLIDATKQELDDQIGRAIRQGEKNTVRDLVRLKNRMVAEADKSIPEYKQARDLFAGKAAMEQATDQGRNFLKLKPREMREITQSLGDSELRMFKLGTKEAILDKIDDLQTSADSVKRLFGKNGDVKKLRYLFRNDEAFKNFSDTLKKESDFLLTRRAAQANSTTAQQQADLDSFMSAVGDAAESVSNPRAAARTISKIMSRLTGKRSEATNIEALEKAGDILLIKGMEPNRIQKILRSGSKDQIKAALESYSKHRTVKPYLIPSTVGGSTEQAKER